MARFVSKWRPCKVGDHKWVDFAEWWMLFILSKSPKMRFNIIYGCISYFGKVVELAGGGFVINGSTPSWFKIFISDTVLMSVGTQFPTQHVLFSRNQILHGVVFSVICFILYTPMNFKGDSFVFWKHSYSMYTTKISNYIFTKLASRPIQSIRCNVRLSVCLVCPLCCKF